MDMAEINTKLTKKDLWKLFFYSEGFVTGFNYEKQEAPWIRLLHDSGAGKSIQRSRREKRRVS